MTAVAEQPIARTDHPDAQLSVIDAKTIVLQLETRKAYGEIAVMAMACIRTLYKHRALRPLRQVWNELALFVVDLAQETGPLRERIDEQYAKIAALEARLAASRKSQAILADGFLGEQEQAEDARMKAHMRGAHRAFCAGRCAACGMEGTMRHEYQGKYYCGTYCLLARGK